MREGIPKEKIFFVGNTMIDTLIKHKRKAEQCDILYRLGLINRSPNDATNSSNLYPVKCGSYLTGAINSITPYAVLTLHRPSNVDDRETFRGILEALSQISKLIPIIFPTHPRTLNRIKEFNFEQYFDDFSTGNWQLTTDNCGIHCVEPLGYLDFLCLMSNAKLVLTDSGGMQEESTILGIPCVTIRETTERPVTVARGTNVVVGTNKETIITQTLNQLNKLNQPVYPPLWDGLAAQRIIEVIIENLSLQFESVAQ